MFTTGRVMKKTEILNHSILTIGAIFMLFPFLWMMSLSFKEESDIYTPSLNLVPTHWDFQNYVEAFNYGEVGVFILNGSIVTLSILMLQYLTIIPAAYVLARKEFRLRALLFTVTLGVLLIPAQVTAIPVYILLSKLGLVNTLPALVIPFATSAFGIFLLRQSFRSVPQDLLDSARIDGAGEFYTLWAIIVPMSLPTLAAFGIFSIVIHWNDYFWPLLVIRDLDKATPPLGISIFASDEGGNDVGPMMASATSIVLPLIVVFLVARKAFIKGLTMTGIKG